MKHYTDAEFEELLKDAVCTIAESYSPPPTEESWARLEKKLRGLQVKDSKNYKYQIVKRMVAGLCFILMATLVFSLSSPATAKSFGQKIITSITNLLGGTKVNQSTSYSVIDPKGSAEMLREIAIGPEISISMDEARAITPFNILTPQYIPKYFTLNQVLSQELIKPYEVLKISLLYSGPETNYFQIIQTNASGEYGEGQGYDYEDALVEEFIAGENTGKKILYKDGRIKLKWMKNNIILSLEGNISHDDALKIVESIN